MKPDLAVQVHDLFHIVQHEHMNCRRLAGSLHLLNRIRAPSQYWAIAVSIAPVLRNSAVLSASSSFLAFSVSINPSSSRFLATYPSRDRSPEA
jgi:hypothetical protein